MSFLYALVTLVFLVVTMFQILGRRDTWAVWAFFTLTSMQIFLYYRMLDVGKDVLTVCS